MARIRISDVHSAESQRSEPKKFEKVIIPHDAGNECYVIGIAASDPAVLASFAKKLVPDHFVATENREAWVALTEINRRKIEVTHASIAVAASAKIADYVFALIETARASQSRKNLDWHVETLMWDAARVRAASGALPAFLEALRDPKSDPDKVQALAVSISATIKGYGQKTHIQRPDELVRSQMVEIEKRVTGHAIYPIGIETLDWFEEKGGERLQRLIPGTAPKMMSVITALSGHGKTTFTARAVLGMMEKGRRVLYGAWEMNAGISLELLACLSLNWSRGNLMRGRGPIATDEGRDEFRRKMEELSSKVIFLSNPFRRKSGEKPSNARNLDLLQGYIEDSGCDVFVGDLWGRVLVNKDPDQEEEALFRMQSITEECKIHSILLAQQRLKDVETRKDQRPTREGIKGSGAWTEAADNVFGIYRPGLAKNVPDDKIEVLVMKQRYGVAPLAVEFDWDADRGSITNGRSVAYQMPGEDNNEVDASVNFITGQKGGRSKRW